GGLLRLGPGLLSDKYAFVAAALAYTPAAANGGYLRGATAFWLVFVFAVDHRIFDCAAYKGFGFHAPFGVWRNRPHRVLLLPPIDSRAGSWRHIGFWGRTRF